MSKEKIQQDYQKKKRLIVVSDKEKEEKKGETIIRPYNFPSFEQY